MPVVENIERIDHYNTSFEKMGYEAMGEYGIKGRRYFRKGGDHRTHQIHVFQYDNLYDIERHLAVRDFLRTHQPEREAYGSLKQSIALQFPRDIDSYCLAKDDFVKNLETKAIKWHLKKIKRD